MVWRRENRANFFAIDQKIPPKVLSRKEHAFVGQAEMHLTLPEDRPCISFEDDIRASVAHS